MQDSEPMKLTNFYIDHPVKIIIGSFTVLAFISIIALVYGYFELSPVTLRDYMILSDDRVIAWDKLEVAEEFLMGGGTETKPLRLTSVKEWNPIVLY